MAVQPPSAPLDNTQPLAKQPLYEGSTQFQHWRYSEEQLQEIRSTLNSAAVETIRNALELDLPGSSANISFLTAEEELLLVRLYIGKVSQLCGHFRFPEEVEATAITYLKRFYLKNTVMDWHPKNVMLTALFLATKTTNNPISIEAYTAHIPKTSPSDVLDLEFLVAQSLNFEFQVWHSHKALWGIYLDIQNLPNTPLDSLHDMYIQASKFIRGSRLTDVELIYAPAQIALAAFSVVSPDLTSSWIISKTAGPLNNIISRIIETIHKDGTGPDVEKVRDIDRRLRICKNPEKVVGSKAYLAKQAEREAKEREKRVRKAEEARRAMQADDPFGEELAPGPEAVSNLDDDDDDDD